MSAFGGSPLTPNQPFDPSNDHTTPNLRGLNPKAMNSPGGLSGTTGADCKLIHGDRWQEIKGKLTENIQSDLATHILGKEAWTIDHNLDFTVKGKEKWIVDHNLDFTVNGETTESFVGEVKDYFHSGSRFEYFGEHTDLHHDHDHQINPTYSFDVLNTEGDYKNIDLAVTSLALEAIGTSVGATVLKGEAWGAGADAWGFQVGAGFFQNEVCAHDMQEKGDKEELKGIHIEVAMIEAEVGGPRTGIHPVHVGIRIAVNIDSPWA